MINVVSEKVVFLCWSKISKLYVNYYFLSEGGRVARLRSNYNMITSPVKWDIQNQIENLGTLNHMWNMPDQVPLSFLFITFVSHMF